MMMMKEKSIRWRVHNYSNIKYTKKSLIHLMNGKRKRRRRLSTDKRRCAAPLTTLRRGQAVKVYFLA